MPWVHLHRTSYLTVVSKKSTMLQKIKKILASADQTIILVLLIISLLALGYMNRFIQDDAFISFRYAENLALGHGLVWNIGDTQPVQGYTNFLWTVLISPAIALKFDPILWSMILGFFCGAGTLFFTYYTAFELTKSRLAAFTSVLLLGTNYTYSSYITGGLETQLQAFLVIASVYLSIFLLNSSSNHKSDRKWYLVLSVLFSLAIMTRLDSVLFCGVLFLALIYSLYTSQADIKEKLSRLAFLIVPGILIIGIWMLFTYLFYGDILPNTFYVKAASNFSLLRGLHYIASFLISYGLIFFFLLGAFSLRNMVSDFKFAIILPVLIVVWMLYIINISGGFMEYRLFVPIMPLIFILISILLLFMAGWKERTTSVLFLLILSIYHAYSFNGSYGIESISNLHARIVDENQDWQGIGLVLGDMFADENTPVIISTTAAGAIPYYSKLSTIDMLGLNDKWIAKNGVVLGSRPGHTRYTTIRYLLDSKVNLVLGHPQVRRRSSPPTTNPAVFFMGQHDFSLLPDTSQVIEIPVNDKYRIDVLYLTKNSVVDDAIKQFGLVTHTIYGDK